MISTSQKTLKGTVVKMALGFKYSSDQSLTLDDIDDWYTEWYCKSKKVKLTKAEHIRLVEGQTVVFYAYVDTELTGEGNLKARLYVPIPDVSAESGDRIEYAEVDTGVIVYK